MLQKNLIGSKKEKYQKGISIVEILVVIVIITIALTSILSLTTLALRASLSIKEGVRANSLAQETIEALRNFRDGTDWNNDDPEDKYDGLGVVSTGSGYYPEKSTDTPPRWTFIQGEEIVDIFARKVVFENVSRDSLDNIVETGGTNDPDSKKATVTVSWKDTKIEIVTYLTNWQE